MWAVGSETERRRITPTGARVARHVWLGLTMTLTASIGCSSDEGPGDAVATTTTVETTVPDASTTGEPEGAEQAIELATAFLEAIDAGDLGSAWELLSPRSQTALGGIETFESMSSGLAEGFAQYASAEDLEVLATPVVAGGDDVWAVTLIATVAQEGPAAPGAAAMVVRVGIDEGPSPFEDAYDGLEFLSLDPEEGSELPPDGRVAVLVPRGLASAQASFDADPPTVIDLTGADEQAARFDLASRSPLTPGVHAVTVVVGTADGRFTATADPYTVNG